MTGETGEEITGEVGIVEEKDQITRKRKRCEKCSRTGSYSWEGMGQMMEKARGKPLMEEDECS